LIGIETRNRTPLKLRIHDRNYFRPTIFPNQIQESSMWNLLQIPIPLFYPTVFIFDEQ
jgi:hypothetical protein